MSESRFLRLEEIVGQRAVSVEQAAVNKSLGLRPQRPRAAIRGIVPVCKTTWELGVRAGKFPAPVRIGRTRVWPAELIEELSERIKRGELAL